MDHHQTLMQILSGRRSIRRFDDQPVAPEDLTAVLEAARWAPTAGNRQAFRLLLATDAALIARMARAVRQVTEPLRGEAAGRPGLSRYLAAFCAFESAPLVIAPIYRAGTDLLRQLAGPHSPLSSDPERDALESVSAAIMSLLLAAHTRGLGACWMTGPLVAEPALSQLLAVPGGWRLAALIPLGHADEQPAAPRRRALDQLVRTVAGVRTVPGGAP